jgi:hypothetical protein
MVVPEAGATRKCPGLKRSGLLSFKAGEAASCRVIPSVGVLGSLTSFNPAGVGSFAPGDRPNRVRPTRRLPVNPGAMKSSTMRGPRGLASECCGRRCRTAKNRRRWIRGRFPFRSPEITSPRAWCKRLRPGRAGSAAAVPRGKPSSDVTHSAKEMTNAGKTAGAGLVPGASPWSVR